MPTCYCFAGWSGPHCETEAPRGPFPVATPRNSSGVPHHIEILVQPPADAEDFAPLSRSPMVRVVDFMGQPAKVPRRTYILSSTVSSGGAIFTCHSYW